MKSKLSIILFFLISIPVVNAQQDIHFSQFNSTPLTLNPATAGVYYGSFRATNSYRTQWGSIGQPFVTINSSLDMPVARNVFDDDFFSGGITFFNDRAGDSQLSTNKGALTIAYGKGFDPSEKHFVSLGVEAGVGQRSVNYSNVTWDSQFTGQGFNNTLPSGESFSSGATTYFDLATGLHYFLNHSDNLKAFGGLAMHHINAPGISFVGLEEKLYRKVVIHGGSQIRFGGSNVYAAPAFLIVRQGPNHMVNIGSDLRFRLKEASHYTGFINEAAFSFGAYFRYGDAFIATTSVSWAGFSLGLSYDMNLSGLSVASNGKGGPEVTLSYRAGYKKGRRGELASERFL